MAETGRTFHVADEVGLVQRGPQARVVVLAKRIKILTQGTREQHRILTNGEKSGERRWIRGKALVRVDKNADANHRKRNEETL